MLSNEHISKNKWYNKINLSLRCLELNRDKIVKHKNKIKLYNKLISNIKNTYIICIKCIQTLKYKNIAYIVVWNFFLLFYSIKYPNY